MVTRTPASIAFALFCAVAASGAVAVEPRPAVRSSTQNQPFIVMRPASAVVMRTERAVTQTLFSTTTSVRAFTVMRPAQAVVISPQEAASQGGKR